MFADDVFQPRSIFHDRPAAREGARKTIDGGHGWIGILAIVILGLAVVEAVLGFRVWTQLSGGPVDGEISRFIYSVGGWLTAPFGRYETFESSRTIGVLQFASLVAAEVYLVAGVLLLIGVFLFRSWLTPVWDLIWLPARLALSEIKAAVAWILFSAGFGLLRLIDFASVVWLGSAQPAARRAIARLTEYTKRMGPIVLRACAGRTRDGFHHVLVFTERQLSMLNLELRRLARDYASARARNFRG